MPTSSKVTIRGAAKSDEPVEVPTLLAFDEKLNSILRVLERNSNDITDIKNEQNSTLA